MNTLRKILYTTVLAVGLAGLAGCTPNNSGKSVEDIVVRLGVTDCYMDNHRYLSYNGMVNDSVFSISSTTTSDVNYY